MRREKTKKFYLIFMQCQGRTISKIKYQQKDHLQGTNRFIVNGLNFLQRRIYMINTQPSRRDFFIVANRIFELQLKPRDFTVYCCLLRHADIANHTCFPSRRLISEECQIDKKTVDIALNNLIDIGLIRKITRTRFDGSKTSNLYHVVDLTKINSE